MFAGLQVVSPTPEDDDQAGSSRFSFIDAESSGEPERAAPTSPFAGFSTQPALPADLLHQLVVARLLDAHACQGLERWSIRGEPSAADQSSSPGGVTGYTRYLKRLARRRERG